MGNAPLREELIKTFDVCAKEHLTLQWTHLTWEQFQNTLTQSDSFKGVS